MHLLKNLQFIKATLKKNRRKTHFNNRYVNKQSIGYELFKLWYEIVMLWYEMVIAWYEMVILWYKMVI